MELNSPAYTETQEERDRKMAEYFSEATLAKGKKAQSPANKLTSQIIKWFIASGGTARRINVMGIYDGKTGKYRKSGMRSGMEDVSACFPVHGIGLSIGVEVKIGKDRQSEDQKIRQAELEKAGGVYIIAKTYEGFVDSMANVLSKYNS